MGTTMNEYASYYDTAYALESNAKQKKKDLFALGHEKGFVAEERQHSCR